ncbi:MAG: transposase, partial [Eubacterium sp.]
IIFGVGTHTSTIFNAKKQETHILNSLIYPYHNGRIEGINNKIKVIKRIAFGYKSFLHFRNRILITQGILKIKAA